MKEFDFIRWIIDQARLDVAAVPVGPGDDCAVLNFGSERLLVTVDQVLDGVHLDVARDGFEAAGYKAAARNLSDIAAMAGEPVAMVAALAAPSGLTIEQAQDIHAGLRRAGDAFACPLVGGDVASWGQAGGRLLLSVTVLGRSAGVRPVLRRGAREGDAICVTGELGGAWRSRRHLEFVPRVREARRLAARCELHAMIDISDGLAADLGHIAAASGLAAELDAAAVPIHADARTQSDPLEAALHDGEDYELLFCIEPEQARKLVAEQPLGVPVHIIGRMGAGAGLTLVAPDGSRRALEPRGWEHST